jgi:aarF domain-containing kinase
MYGRNKIRNVKLIGSTCFLLWGFDKYLNYSTIQRNIRTFYTGAIITLDYKLNFNKEKANEINDLHERTARRILNLCKENGGLYIKFGQQMATVPVLPPPYLRNLRELYDQALCFDYKTVEKIFMKEFGLKPTEIFSSFDETPIASASIAQVHKAILKSGEEVAVKIQKPEIEKQIWFDMLAYRIVLKSLEYFFELPLYWTADYIEKHLVQEVDFVNELNNSEKCHLHILEKPKLASKCYVPKVFQDYSSMRIMTTEWISGASLSDPKEVEKLGFSKSAIMTDVINVFSDQLFRTGFVHCDPHPGNILIRKHPNNVGHQVVILDHGLYIQCRPEFTRQYALFWKSLFSLDIDTTRIITESWGLENAEIFASATLARPWKSGKAIHVEKVTAKDIYDSQVDAKRKVSEFLKNTDKLPKELIFVGRNLK